MADLSSEGSNRFTRAFDPKRRPDDRQIEPGLAICGDPIAAMTDRSKQADRIENTITQRLATGSLFGFVGLGYKAARTQQTLKEWQSSEEPEIGADVDYDRTGPQKPEYRRMHMWRMEQRMAAASIQRARHMHEIAGAVHHQSPGP